VTAPLPGPAHNVPPSSLLRRRLRAAGRGRRSARDRGPA
jgi:hypothetical protein